MFTRRSGSCFSCVWLLEPQHLTALLSSTNSAAAPATAQHPAPAPWPTSAAAACWDVTNSGLRAPSSSGVPWRQHHVHPNLGCPGSGRPIQQEDEGKSTRALAIPTIMSYMSYMSSKHFSFAFRIAAGATTHTAYYVKNNCSLETNWSGRTFNARPPESAIPCPDSSGNIYGKKVGTGNIIRLCISSWTCLQVL